MKKCLIFYYSYHHSNTEKIANAMAKTANATLCAIEYDDIVDSKEYEIIGFGSGIAFGKHYKMLLKMVSELDLNGKKVFVFSTSGMGKESSNSALIELLKQAGADAVGSFACKGYDTVGPFKLLGGIAKGHPDLDDVDEAKKFIQRMVN